jgi:AP-4 complex subunit mu-1
MISQLFVLSARGDTIVARDYRHDVPRTSHDAFFRALKFGAGGADGGGGGGAGEDAPPVFLQDGVNYFHVKARTCGGAWSACVRCARACWLR